MKRRRRIVGSRFSKTSSEAAQNARSGRFRSLRVHFYLWILNSFIAGQSQGKQPAAGLGCRENTEPADACHKKQLQTKGGRAIKIQHCRAVSKLVAPVL